MPGLVADVSDMVSRETVRTMVALMKCVVEERRVRWGCSLNCTVSGQIRINSDHTDVKLIGSISRITCGLWVGFYQNQSLSRGKLETEQFLSIWIELVCHVT